MVEAFDPTPGLLIVVNLMLGSAPLSLSLPESGKMIFIKDVAVFLSPFPEGFPASAVNRRETTQLAELLRELRDFR